MRLDFLFFLASVSLAFSPYHKVREFLGLERRDNGYYVYTVDREVISVPTAGNFYGVNYWSWLKIYTTDGYLVYSYLGEVVSVPLSYYDSEEIPYLLSDYSLFYGSEFNPSFFTDSIGIEFPSIDIGTVLGATEGSGGGMTHASATTKGTNGGNGSGTEKTTDTNTKTTSSGPITTSPSKSSIVSSIKSSIKSANSAKSSEKSQSASSASASETSSKNVANLQTSHIVMVPLMLVFSVFFM